MQNYRVYSNKCPGVLQFMSPKMLFVGIFAKFSVQKPFLVAFGHIFTRKKQDYGESIY